jgi:hypothetical protein
MVAAAFDWVISLDSKDGHRRISGIGKFEIENANLLVKQYQLRPKLALA